MDFYFVQPLGKFRVKQAVPKLVEQVRKLEDRGWEVRSSAYGSRAAYLVKALEQITGQAFPRDAANRYPDKDSTLKAVNAWWAKQDKKSFEAPATEPDTQPAGTRGGK